jgi:hypothetical protein
MHPCLLTKNKRNEDILVVLFCVKFRIVIQITNYIIPEIYCHGDAMNPFLSSYTTPFGIPPFEQIKPEHILPAFQKGLQEQITEYKNIENSQEEPTFKNTLEAMERSGALLNRVLR